MAWYNSLWRIFHPGPIIALTIVFICYTVSIIDSMVWLSPPHASIKGKINLVVLTFWLALILGNFFRAVLKGPGYVPLNWRPAKKGDEKFMQYCQICQGYKPPRAHHCRTCQRCVLKMDHHCPWINNCTGHFNHTNFVGFVFFAPVGCMHAFIVFVMTVWYQLFHRDHYLRIATMPVHFSINALLMNLFAMGLALGTTVAVGVLFYYQLKSVISNCTGIEQWIVDKAEDRCAAFPDATFIYPYDLGKKNNILQVINLSCAPYGDGYTWPVVEGCHQYTLTIEQIRQKILKRDRMVPYQVHRNYSGRWFPITHGCCTCLRIPCTDEPRIYLQAGDTVIVSRGQKYWLYGDKVLTAEQVKSGIRVRGWFPRNCSTRQHQSTEDIHYYNNHKEKIS